MRIYEITMDGRDPVKLTLNLGALYVLSASEHDLWDRYNALYTKLQQRKVAINELEMGEMIYIAYRCAALGIPDEKPMTLQEFLTDMTDSREEIGKVFQQLYGVQEKKQAFPMPSGKQRRR